MRRKLIVIAIAAAVAASTAIAAVALADSGAEVQQATIGYHPQSGQGGVVDGAVAQLTRNENGIGYNVRTAGLVPGDVYTLWIAVVNDPENCSANPCGAGEILDQTVTDSQVSWGAGRVASSQGTATFAGRLSEGDNLEGWLPEAGMNDAKAAQVHLVLNSHGPLIEDLRHDMLSTYRGGCSDASPFPPPFPATALADGTPGPNICLLYQVAVLAAS